LNREREWTRSCEQKRGKKRKSVLAGMQVAMTTSKKYTFVSFRNCSIIIFLTKKLLE
jgi:hypothetical protein